MSVSLGNVICFVCFISQSLRLKYCWVSAEAHGTAEFTVLYLFFLLFHDIYDWVLSVPIHFRRMGTFETDNRPRILNNRQLHTVTEPKIWNLMLSDKFYRADNTLHAA